MLVFSYNAQIQCILVHSILFVHERLLANLIAGAHLKSITGKITNILQSIPQIISQKRLMQLEFTRIVNKTEKAKKIGSFPLNSFL